MSDFESIHSAKNVRHCHAITRRLYLFVDGVDDHSICQRPTQAQTVSKSDENAFEDNVLYILANLVRRFVHPCPVHGTHTRVEKNFHQGGLLAAVVLQGARFVVTAIVQLVGERDAVAVEERIVV